MFCGRCGEMRDFIEETRTMRGEEDVTLRKNKGGNNNMGNSEWIKCSERLPYNDQMVLVPIINKEIPCTEILICRYIKCERPMFRHYGFRGIKDFIDVTHWMPMPDAPEVEG